VRVYRALARDLGREDEAAEVRVPRHEPGPPETLTDADYGNLLRVPDRRTIAGKRDYALVRVLGDCGLRSAELRGLRARDLRRPRSNARRYRLYVRGKGGREREVPRFQMRSSRRSTRGRQSIRSHAASACSTSSSRCSCALAATAAKNPSRCRRLPCTAWCAGHAWLPACPTGSRNPTHCALTGPRICWRPAFPCMRPPRGSGTSICAPPPATPAPRPERVDDVAEVLDRRHQAARRAGRVA